MMYHRTSRLVLRGCTTASNSSRNNIAGSLRRSSSYDYYYYQPSLLCSRFSDWTSSSTHTSSRNSGSASSSSSTNASWTTTALVLASSAVVVTTTIDELIMPRRRNSNKNQHHKTLNEPAAAYTPTASDIKTDNHDGPTNSTTTEEDQDISTPKEESRSKKTSKHRHSKRKSRARSSTSNTRQQPQSDDTLFCGQWLQRQLFQPKVPYPAWDYNWDDRMTSNTTFEALKTIPGLMASRQSGITRHIVLIRHGQYDETYQSDALRPLTKLGRKQAELTGLRLALWAKGGVGDIDNELFAKPCNIKSIYVSDMLRAKETAAIIAQHLPHVPLHNADPLLNEALPSPMIPIRPDVTNAIEEIDQHHNRIEQAYQKYFYRAISTDNNSTTNTQHDTIDKDGRRKEVEECSDDGLKHEFEIIVGHGNVIRYFACRALQIPPEAWLRLSVFNCSITYITIQPNGYVSVRLLGDVGHLRYDETTFSGNIGFHW